MNLILTNTGSYPRIGDTPEQQVLRRAIAASEKGEKTEADVREAERKLTQAAIDEQLDAGLDLPTDGQIRWYDPISYISGKLEGVKINGLLRFFDTNFYFRQPVVQALLRRRRPILLDDYKFASTVSAKPVKVVLTGPYTLAKYSIVEDSTYKTFEKLVEGYTVALAEEIQELVKSGAKIIQVDEPAILKNPEDFQFCAASLKVLSQAKGNSTLALYTYFGDASSLYKKLQDLPVDALGIDFTYNSALVDRVCTESTDKVLGLGLVDGRNTRLESEASIRSALEKILPALKSGYAYLNPSCGLEYLPRDRAYSKLKNMVSLAKNFTSSK